MGMFSQNEILLMILVVSVLLIFIVILTILDIRDYRKEKNVEKDDLSALEETTIEENIVDIKPLENEMIEVLEVPKEEKIEVHEVEEDNNHIEPLVIQEIEEPKEEDNQYNIMDIEEEYVPHKLSLDEELAKIEETMVDTDEKLENTITSFEEEQERTAIISLDELLKHSDNLYSQNEITQYNDDNAPISIDEAINTISNDIEVNEIKEVETPKVLEEALKEEKPLYTHKEEMPFISSIYGIENDLSFENTANFEKMDRAKTNEFMKKLREMNENK